MMPLRDAAHMVGEHACAPCPRLRTPAMHIAIANLPSTAPASRDAVYAQFCFGSWDAPETHELLRQELDLFDGWAVGVSAEHLPLWEPWGDVLTWSRLERPVRSARARRRDEFIVVHRAADVPTLFGAVGSLRTDDVIDGRTSSKPVGWTLWALAQVGYRAGVDEVTDIFMNASVEEATDGMLPLYLEGRAA